MVCSSLSSMAACTADRKPLRLARPVKGSLRASQARRSSRCLLSVMSDTEHTTAESRTPSASSPRGRELTDSHWSLPCSSRTPMTTLVLASCDDRARARGSASTGKGEPSSRSAAFPPVKMASPRLPRSRAPRMRVAESLVAATAPWWSMTTTPSSRAATAAAYCRSMAARAAAASSASLRSEMSRMITWKAGFPFQLVRALAISTGSVPPSERSKVASKPFTTLPGSFNCARRAMVAVRSSGEMNEVMTRPTPSASEDSPTMRTAVGLP